MVYEQSVQHAATRGGVDSSCWDRDDLAVVHAELIDQVADAVVVGGDDADHLATSWSSTSLDCLVVAVVVQLQMPPSGPSGRAGQVSTWLLLMLTAWSSSLWWA
ncbi:hypothetical protein [Mycolicibacterium baixiangningiae]|uniref:hypothetical protein n=1 Tax=Mycolicibacterium baixiangningiae TaxID=2761578 RepID=UPI0018664BF3|nr:hypothetical protein [Mycolicibacterium baixiangningiae]